MLISVVRTLSRSEYSRYFTLNIDDGISGVFTFVSIRFDNANSFSSLSDIINSAAYYARFVAKAIVAANLSDRCEVSLSYSISVANPVSVSVDTFGTGVTSDEVLLKIIKENFNFTPSSIIKELRLDKVKFKPLESYGHIGRVDLDVAWEQVDAKAKQLSESYEQTKSATRVL